MSYYLQNQFSNFKWNYVLQEGPYNIKWYKWISDPITNREFSDCFTQEELNDFVAFCTQTPNNFANQNYFLCNQEERIEWTQYDALPRRNGTPSYLILKPNPQASVPGTVFSFMDVTLDPIHNYNLPFNVIGKIII